jgi:hypothetical protein
VEALKALGITPGPIYAKIKAGSNVQLNDGTLVILLKLNELNFESF